MQRLVPAARRPTGRGLPSTLAPALRTAGRGQCRPVARNRNPPVDVGGRHHGRAGRGDLYRVRGRGGGAPGRADSASGWAPPASRCGRPAGHGARPGVAVQPRGTPRRRRGGQAASTGCRAHSAGSAALPRHGAPAGEQVGARARRAGCVVRRPPRRRSAGRGASSSRAPGGPPAGRFQSAPSHTMPPTGQPTAAWFSINCRACAAPSTSGTLSTSPAPRSASHPATSSASGPPQPATR